MEAHGVTLSSRDTYINIVENTDLIWGVSWVAGSLFGADRGPTERGCAEGSGVLLHEVHGEGLFLSYR